MSETTFDCCFEREEKGVFLEVDKGSECVEFNIFNDFKPGVGVCLRKNDTERLIKLLQEHLSEMK